MSTQQILPDKDSRILFEQFKALRGALLKDDLTSFQKLLRSADVRVFEVFHKELTLWELAFAKYKEVKQERYAVYLSLIINKHPDVLDKATALRVFGRITWLHNGRPQSDETKFLLRQLIYIYRLPNNDESLLQEINKFYSDPKLIYAMARNFPKSITAGLSKANPIFLVGVYINKAFFHLKIQVLRACDKDVSPTEREALAVELAKSIRYDGYLKDMFSDFEKRILGPLLVVASGKSLGNFKRTAFSGDLLIKTFVRLWSKKGFKPSQIIERCTQLAHTWHHPAIQFVPDGMQIPEEFTGVDLPVPEWYPLLSVPYATKNGKYILRSLQNQNDLDCVRRVLGHCVDGYTQPCQKGLMHLLSVESIDGARLSTFQVCAYESEEAVVKYKIHWKSGDKYLAVTQHEEKNIHSTQQSIIDGSLHDAVQEWARAVLSGECQINLTQKGSTDNYLTWHDRLGMDSGLLSQLQSFGYHPTLQNIESAFRDLKKNTRAGSVGIDEGGRLIYSPDPPHLIDGAVEIAGDTYALRDMTLMDFLRATGLLEKCAGFILNHDVEGGVAKAWLLREQSRPLAAIPVETLRNRAAYALAAGTLTGQELNSLPPDELKQYKRRRRLNRREGRYTFVREPSFL